MIKRCLIYFIIGRNFIKKIKLTAISHDKMNHLANNCVTMNEWMNRFSEKTDLSETICEHWSKLCGKSSKANLKNISQY